MIWKKDLLKEIQYQLGEYDVPKTEDCDEWIKENYPKHIQEDKTPTPDFHFTMADAKWGDGHGCVNATVLKFWFAEKDGM
eukprot:13408878-Ditylum_brightwellii.AAC.1